MPRSKGVLLFCGSIFLLAAAAWSQESPRVYTFAPRVADSGPIPLSNSAVDILARSDSLWIGGGKGLDLTFDGGRSWRHVGDEAPFAHEDISAIAGRGPILWTAMAGSEDIGQGTTLPKGLGLAYSTDAGAHWTKVDQPMEQPGDSTFVVTYGSNRLKSLAITTPINNITYDIAVTKDAVWIASFAGGLRKSTDLGRTFVPVVLPPDNLDSISVAQDSLDFDLSPVDRSDYWNLAGTNQAIRGNLNHRVFSVLALSDSSLLVGTAGGINVTSDAGASWRKFTYSNGQQPISGNFVVALGINRIGGREAWWASTINAEQPQEFRAVSMSTDRGATWTTSLRGEFTNNFGFRDSVVYAATNTGIFRSDDGGTTWSHYQTFVDRVTHARSTDERCYDAASQGDSIWVANADGLMWTRDNDASHFGDEWHILRAAQPTASNSRVYAYPNPFSPDDEVCRVHYRTGASGSVSIAVYDFAMFPVRTILRNATRTADTELDEIWDGKNDNGKQVANGLYYIQVKTDDNDPSWAKIIVLQ